MSDTSTSLIEIPENVIIALQLLPPEKRQQVYEFAEFLSYQEQLKNEQTNLYRNPQTPIKHRIIGLHQGQGSISDDFADPLPEEF
jgi:hypothetical protein